MSWAAHSSKKQESALQSSVMIKATLSVHAVSFSLASCNRYIRTVSEASKSCILYFHFISDGANEKCSDMHILFSFNHANFNYMKKL